jgi:hypothetical protein
VVQVDLNVSRLKYEREVNRLRDQQSALQSRGIFIMGSTTFPVVDLAVVPHHSLQVAVPTLQAGHIILPQGTVMAAKIFSLAARAFKAHFDLSDYDLRAPSLEFRDLWTDALLPYATMFRGLEFEQERRAHIVLLDNHPVTGKPFLCLRGIREYHEHPQHSGDEWLLYRSELSLFSTVMSMWRTCVDLIHPLLSQQPAGLQLVWNAEEKL